MALTRRNDEDVKKASVKSTPDAGSQALNTVQKTQQSTQSQRQSTRQNHVMQDADTSSLTRKSGVDRLVDALDQARSDSLNKRKERLSQKYTSGEIGLEDEEMQSYFRAKAKQNTSEFANDKQKTYFEQKKFEDEFKVDRAKDTVEKDYQSMVDKYGEDRIHEIARSNVDYDTEIQNLDTQLGAMVDSLKTSTDLNTNINTSNAVLDLQKEKKRLEEERDIRNEFYKHMNDLEYLEYGNDQEKGRVADVVNSADDEISERLVKGMGSSALGIMQTGFALYDSMKDFGLEVYADINTAKAMKELENGQIDQETYETILRDSEKARSFQANDENNISQQLRKEMNYMNGEIQEGLSTPEKFVVDSINGTTNFLLQYALLGEVGSLISMSGQSGTQKYYELIDKGYDAKTSFMNAAATGLVSYMTEKIGMDNFVSVLNGTAGQSAFGQIVNAVSKNRISNYYAQSVLSGAAAEGLEEVVEGLVDPIVDSVTLGTPIEYNAGDLFYSFLVGASSGALMSGAGAIRGSQFVVNTKQQYNQLSADIETAREILKDPKVKREEAEALQKIIRNGEIALSNFGQMSKVAMSVEKVSDQATVTTKAEGDSALAQSVYPNASEISQTFEQRRESIARLNESVSAITQEWLFNNNVMADVNEFMEATPESREEMIKAGNYASQLGKSVEFRSDESIRQQLAETMRKNGMSEVEISNLVNDESLFVDGYVKDGTIVLNMKSKYGQLSTLVHELTHGTESSKFYNALHEAVQEYLGSDYTSTLDKTKSLYEGIADDPEHELVAKTTQDSLLLGNEQFLDRLVRYNESLAYRILKDIQSMTDSDVKTRVENSFMKAFRDAGRNVKPGLKYAVGKTADERGQQTDLTDLERISQIAPDSIDDYGNIKPLSQQIDEMLNNPGKYGLVTVSLGNAAEDNNIPNEIYLSKTGYTNSLKGMSKAELINVLNNSPSTIVSVAESLDENAKDIFLDTDDGVYTAHLKKEPHSGYYQIQVISSVQKPRDVANYISLLVNRGERFYENEKSNQFLQRYLVSDKTLWDTVASTYIRPKKAELVKRVQRNGTNINGVMLSPRGVADYYKGIKGTVLFDGNDLNRVNDIIHSKGIKESIDNLEMMRELIPRLEVKKYKGEHPYHHYDAVNTNVYNIEEIAKSITPERFAKVKEQYLRKASNSSEEVNNASESVQDKVIVNENEGSAAPQFSLSTWNNTDKETVKNDLVKALGVSEQKADKWINDVNGVAKIIADDRTRLDYEPNGRYSAMKSNDEYVASMDMSTLCKKREVLQGTIDEIQNRLPNYNIDGEEYTKIRQMMKDKGYEVACGFCYVESRRKELGNVAKKFIESRNYSGLTIRDLTTVSGVSELQKNHPDIYEDFVKFNNKRGSGKVNLVESRTEYRGEIMRLTKAQIDKITRIGGLRLQSYSDFETPHLIDMMQIVVDMARRGLTSQAYTKIPNFADAFGDTGIKINESLVCKGVDENGELIFDDVEGMPHDKAFEIRDRHPENVGTILVGKDDATILAAMADDRIDFIIPFHRSGWGQAEYERLGIKGYKDYTSQQKEYWITPKTKNNGKKETAPSDQFYPIDYWDYSKSGKENAEEYLRICAEDGRIPKFSDFLVNNGDGSWSLQPDGSTDGYWKMLIDFKMYDNNGVGAPQQKVQPVFNNEVNEQIMNEYGGEHRINRFAPDVVEEFVKEHQNSNTQFSISSERRDLHKQRAIEEYGTTYDYRKAAYILDDGSYLNFAYPGQNYRTEDHRSISSVFDEDYDTQTQYLTEFMNEGNIRVVPESNGVDVSAVAEPTEKQYSKLRNYLGNFFGDWINVDISDENGYPVASIEYEPRTRSTKIISDLKQFYKDRTLPEEANKSQWTQYSLFFDSEGRKLSRKQREFFKDSKMVDDDGNLVVMYHGTSDGGFSVFDPDESDDGASFFFTDDPDMAVSYVDEGDPSLAWDGVVPEDNRRNRIDPSGEKQKGLYEVYLNLKNPLVIDAEGHTWDRLPVWMLSDKAKEYNNFRTVDDYVRFAKDYGSELSEDEIREELDGLSERWLTTEVPHNLYMLFDNWEEIEGIEDFFELAGNDEYATTRDWSAFAKEHGYDGVIIKRVSDYGAYSHDSYKTATVGIAFDSNQVKAVSNQNPTSDSDIRYSLSLDDPSVNRIRSNFSTRLGEVSFETRDEQTEYDNLLDKAVDEAYREGKVSEETIDSLAQSYYEGVKEVVTTEGMYKRKDVKDFLKSTPISTQSMMSSNNYKDLRKDSMTNRGYGDFSKDEWNMILRSNKGNNGLFRFLDGDKSNTATGIDSVYMEFANTFPGLVDPNLTSPKDQYLELLNAYDSIAPRTTREAVDSFSNIREYIASTISDMTKEIQKHKDYLAKMDELELTQEQIDKAVRNKADKMYERARKTIEENQKFFKDNAKEWVPNFRMIADKFDLINEDLMGYAAYEQIFQGAMSDTTRDMLFNNILENDVARELQGNLANEYIDSIIDNINQTIELETNYQSNQRFNDSVAGKANRILNAFEGKDDIDTYDQVETDALLKKGIKAFRKATRREISDAITMLIDKGGNKVNVLDMKSLWDYGRRVAKNDPELADAWNMAFNEPFFAAQTTLKNTLESEGKNLERVIEETGIRGNTKEAKAVGWIIEGRKQDGTQYTESDLRAGFGDKADSILKFASEYRKAMERMFVNINENLDKTYGDSEVNSNLFMAKLSEKARLLEYTVQDLREKSKNNPSREIYNLLRKAEGDLDRARRSYDAYAERMRQNTDRGRQELLHKENYFHHIKDGHPTAVAKRFIDSVVAATKGTLNTNSGIPSELIGLTDRTKPLTRWSTLFLHQGRSDYSSDGVASWSDYITEYANIMSFNPLSMYMRDAVNEMRAQDPNSDMNHVIRFLEDYTNSLDAKSNPLDRWLRDRTHKPVMDTIRGINSLAKKNAVMGNIGSAIVQFGNLPLGLSLMTKEGGAKATQDFVKGLQNYMSKKKYADMSPFLSTRYFDIATKDAGLYDGIQRKMDAVMSFGDKTVADILWNGFYEQGKRLGKEAIQYADEMTRRSIAGRGVGEVPLTLQSSLVNLFIPFQVEVNNQWQQMKDLVQEPFRQGSEGNRGKEALSTAGAITTLLVTSFIMNALMEALIGRRPLFDPLDVFLKSLQDGDDEDTAWTRVWGEVLSAIPGGQYVPSLMGMSEDDAEKMFGESDPSRYGVGNIGAKAVWNIGKKFAEGDPLSALSDLIANFNPIGGGKQFQRSWEGLQSMGVIPTFNKNYDEESGSFLNPENWERTTKSYTDKGKLRFVNDPDNKLDYFRAFVGGKWNTSAAREYINSGFDTYSQTNENISDVLSSIGHPMYKQMYQGSSSGENAYKFRKALEKEGVWDEFIKEVENRYDEYLKTVPSDKASTYAEFINHQYGLTKKVVEGTFVPSTPIEETAEEPEAEASSFSFFDFLGDLLNRDKEETEAAETEKPVETVPEEAETTRVSNKVYDSFTSSQKYDEKKTESFHSAMDLDGVYKDADGNITDERTAGSKKVANSEAIETRKALEEMGEYENVLDYIAEHGLKASDFGLTDTVIGWNDEKFDQKYEAMFGDGEEVTPSSSSTEKKSSSKSSSKKTTRRSSGRRSSKTTTSEGMQDFQRHFNSVLSRRRSSSNTRSLLNEIDSARKSRIKKYKRG